MGSKTHEKTVQTWGRRHMKKQSRHGVEDTRKQSRHGVKDTQGNSPDMGSKTQISKTQLTEDQNTLNVKKNTYSH